MSENIKDVILINRVLCEKCRDIIVSKGVHDFVTCTCKNVSVDGGNFYLKRSWNDFNSFIDLSECISIDKDYDVDRTSYRQADFKSMCCKCESKNILVRKGNGEHIIGNDILGYTCENCKCLYVFNNIKFKYNKKI